MAEKPTKFPDWATEDQIDPVSGQPNTVEPPEARKQSGWTREEIPPRQWFNWLARVTAEWLRWVEEQVADLGTAATKDVEDDGGTVVETQNLGTAARQADTRYAHRANNLSDLADADAGRSNLGVPYASAAEAIAGTAENRVLSPARLRDGLNASGAAPVFGVRAWANFDGKDVDVNGMCTIRASGNIAQVQRLSAGLYQITFAVPMQDANYAVSVGVSQNEQSAGSAPDQANVYDFQTTGFKAQSSVNTSSSFGEFDDNLARITFSVVR